ncbi:hypothetical protein B0J18DRAFT_479553 [Chaetomium sp. MPI-SDFR-AT-0129]|nr:hypothetical protein B0J18DRAFT_479553 [Chaetomium sp. MPI-SDFR-AT-0129]
MARKVKNHGRPLERDLHGGTGGKEGATTASNSHAGCGPGARVKQKKAPDKAQKAGKLSCPIRDGDPERYGTVTHNCQPGQTYKGMQRLIEHIVRYHAEYTRCSKCMKVYLDGVPQEHSDMCRKELTDGELSKYPTILSSKVMEKVKNWMERWKKTEPEGKKENQEPLPVRRRKFFSSLICDDEDVLEPSRIVPNPPPSSDTRQRQGKRRASSSPTGKPARSRFRDGDPETPAEAPAEDHRAEDPDPGTQPDAFGEDESETQQDEPDGLGDDGLGPLAAAAFAKAHAEHHGAPFLDPGTRREEPPEFVNPRELQITHRGYSNPTLDEAALPFKSPYSADTLQPLDNIPSTMGAIQQQPGSAPPSLTIGRTSSENTGLEYPDGPDELDSPSTALLLPDDFEDDSGHFAAAWSQRHQGTDPPLPEYPEKVSDDMFN